MNGNPIWLVVLAAVIAGLPLAVGVLTSYLKISIILGFLRSGLGTQHVPGSLTIMTISLALTFYIMSPVIEKTLTATSTIDFKIFESTPTTSSITIFAPVFKPWRDFMQLHVGSRELSVLGEVSSHTNKTLGDGQPELKVLVPAFALTEIKEGFLMGFLLLLPFLVVDLIIANILAGMGMYMLSPVLISLPLKLIIFVLVDGWLLLTKGIINSYMS